MTTSTDASIRRPIDAPPRDGQVAIVPSRLEVDFAHLVDKVVALERAGGDRLQGPIMDGHVVPRLTHGANLVRRVRDATALPFEAR